MDRSLAEVEYMPEEIQLATFARALSHPVRIKIVKILIEQSCCYTGDLTEIIPLAQSTISQHLNVLKKSGLIQGEIMPPKVKYCLNLKNWAIARSVLEDIFLTHK